jgi:hypothetical protein
MSPLRCVRTLAILACLGCAKPNSSKIPPPSGAALKPSSRATCANFEGITPYPKSFPGPSFALFGLQFDNPAQPPSGSPVPIELLDRPETLDGKPELWIASSVAGSGSKPLVLGFPGANFPNGVDSVWVELRHFASAQVEAYGMGSVVSQANQPNQNVRAFLFLTGPKITRIAFNAVETQVFQVCWTQ